MRQLIAVLATFSLANLLFVQGGVGCPMAGGASAAVSIASPVSGHDGHGGHHASPSSTGDSAQTLPDDHTSEPLCLTMGPCVLTLDVAQAADIADAPRPGMVVGLNAFFPPSPSAAPDLPPPRA